MEASEPIERLIEANRWADARALLRQRLRREPRDHWLLTRLSLTYYEQRRYGLALRYAEKAFDEVPSCPLVLWDYAGALQMLDRHGEALDLYARLVTRGVAGLRNDACSEGKAWVRGLVSDAHYRASLSLEALGNKDASLSALECCLDLRGPGCRSIYRLEELGGAALSGGRPGKRMRKPARRLGRGRPSSKLIRGVGRSKCRGQR